MYFNVIKIVINRYFVTCSRSQHPTRDFAPHIHQVQRSAPLETLRASLPASRSHMRPLAVRATSAARTNPDTAPRLPDLTKEHRDAMLCRRKRTQSPLSSKRAKRVRPRQPAPPEPRDLGDAFQRGCGVADARPPMLSGGGGFEHERCERELEKSSCFLGGRAGAGRRN